MKIDAQSSQVEWPAHTKLRMVRIAKAREEFPGNKTFFMDEELGFEPGQFVMVWLPGVDEKPMALVPWGKKFALNIEAKGIATAKMLGLKEGDSLGIRGPYGRPFTCKGVKKAIIIAGGIGIDSVILLAQRLHELNCETVIILGGRARERIIFEQELSGFGKVMVSTDDGSYGEKGRNTGLLERELEKQKPDMVYACGPELMMAKAFEVVRKFGCGFECSLERHMKCGIGICGECVMDEKLVCIDGPVFNSGELQGSSEFGKTAYLKSGKRVPLSDYCEWRQK